MPTLLRLSKAERETLREAFRQSAWLEPSPSDPTDPDKSEWAAFEDDALMRMIPAFEAILEARAADETSTGGDTQSAQRDTQDGATNKTAESGTSQKPGESFGDFLSAMAAPFVGEVAGFIVGGNWGDTRSATRGGTGSKTRSNPAHPAADLLTGLMPTITDALVDLFDAKASTPRKPTDNA